MLMCLGHAIWHALLEICIQIQSLHLTVPSQAALQVSWACLAVRCWVGAVAAEPLRVADQTPRQALQPPLFAFVKNGAVSQWKCMTMPAIDMHK